MQLLKIGTAVRYIGDAAEAIWEGIDPAAVGTVVGYWSPDLPLEITTDPEMTDYEDDEYPIRYIYYVRGLVRGDERRIDAALHLYRADELEEI